jgi:hypothetical protein
MKRFILVDHSLTDYCGHHYAYDYSILSAAAHLGYRCVLVSNRQFSPGHELAFLTDFLRPFRYTSYNRYATFSGEEDRTQQVAWVGTSWKRPTADWTQPGLLVRQYAHALHYWWGRRKRINHYVRSSNLWFKKIGPQEEDIVFLPTMTDFDFECLAEFLRRIPQTESVHWHLQFHFPFLEGSSWEYPGQQRILAIMQSFFKEQRSKLPRHKLYFYTTSEVLQQQYTRLVDHVDSLPYPITRNILEAGRNSGAKVSHTSKESSRPLIALCAGAHRPEKGFQFVDVLVSSLWKYFESGRIQLRVQRSDRKNFIERPAHLSPQQWEKAVQEFPFPLSPDAYAELIRDADIGLFLYNARRYYARVSGILVEMLAVGVPVIVPAGCWLSQQILPRVYEYQDEIIDQYMPIALDRLQAKVFGRIPVQFARKRANPGPQYLATRVTFPNEISTSDAFLKQTITELDSHGKIIAVRSHLFYPRDEGTPTPCVLRLRTETNTWRVEWGSPFGHELGGACHIDWGTFCLPEDITPIAESAVGLVASDVWQFPVLLEEMIENHAHYKKTAEAFSNSWKSRHDPVQTVLNLHACQGVSAPGTCSRPTDGTILRAEAA